MWRVATVVIVLLGLTLGCVTIVAMGLARLLDYLVCTKDVNEEKSYAKCMQRPLERLILSIGVLVYCVSSAYLISQSFSQLFALPATAFIVPSWTNYWPHFS